MRRISGILLALFMLATILFVLVPTLSSERSLPVGAQARLNAYLRNPSTFPTQSLSVHRFIQASRPWNFTPQMSAATWGDSAYYRTTHGYWVTPVSTSFLLWGSPTRSVDNLTYAGGGPRPLPFPPIELWCVLLRQEGQASPVIVLLALHEDLYNADWILHEPSGDAQAVAAHLAQVGCELDLRD
jgi:hypothetical protein